MIRLRSAISLSRRWLPVILIVITAPCLWLTLSVAAGEDDSIGKLSAELDELTLSGMTYRFLDGETVEVTEPWSGRKVVKTLRHPGGETIEEWAARNGIPIYVVNPDTVDTNRYEGWFTYWTTVPLSNGFGYPPQISDIDSNRDVEIYGVYKDSGSYDFHSRVYEVNSIGSVYLRHEYIPRRGASQQFTDVDNDGLKEIMFQYGDSSFIYEQKSDTTLPTNYFFAHGKYEYPGTAITHKEVVGRYDDDVLDDFIYVGTFPDSAPPGFQYFTYVAEYDTSLNNFRKIWRTQLHPPPGESTLGGYDVGDYDGDGIINFLASGLWGDVWVLENSGDNVYRISWTDSLPLVNVYYQTSGDVDNDTRREFFVSATMSDGNWITVYENDSDDNYFPTFLFQLLSGGSLDEPTLMTPDVDGDGIPEFVILSGADLYMFKSREDNLYWLWYYKRNNAKQSIQFYDFDGDGKNDFIITKSFGTWSGYIYFLADIFRAGDLVGVEKDETVEIPRAIRLSQNYPNPFNARTKIEFDLFGRQNIDLSIFDLLGNRITILASGDQTAGRHTVVWDGSTVASGIYICRLRSPMGETSMKLLLIR